MRIADHLSKEKKQHLNNIGKHTPKKKQKIKASPVIPAKEEKINWFDLMDQNKRGLRRGKGGAWR